MLIPIRCYTCHRVVANVYDKYQQLLSDGVEPDVALDELGLHMYCCRRMMISQVDIIDELLEFDYCNHKIPQSSGNNSNYFS